MNKKKKSFKDDFKKHPVGFSLIFLVLVVIGLVILFMNLDSTTPIWPLSSDINKKKKELEEVQKALQKELNLLHEKDEDVKSFVTNTSNFWITLRDGDPKVNLQKRINNAAGEHEFLLSSVGAVRTDKITEGIFLMSTAIRGEGNFQNLTEFLGKIQMIKPKLYWQNLLLRPKSTKTPDILMLSGTLQVVAIEDENISKLLLDKK